MSDYEDDYDHDRDFDDEDGEETVESYVWQLLLMINPGDEASALQQFKSFQEEVEDQGDEDPMRIVGQVTDWRASFEVDGDDTRAIVEAINELVARWNLQIDWDGDPDDDEFHEDIEAGDIFSRAYDQLNEHGYTLWSRETEDDDTVAGWITSTRDNEGMRLIATALEINLRLGNQLG